MAIVSIVREPTDGLLKQCVLYHLLRSFVFTEDVRLRSYRVSATEVGKVRQVRHERAGWGPEHPCSVRDNPENKSPEPSFNKTSLLLREPGEERAY